MTGPGAALPELNQLLEDFPLHVGDILRQDLYEEGKAVFLQGAINLGYFDAEFQRHQILVDRVQLRYRLTPTWDIESTLGYDSGADLFYRIEFD